MRELKYTQEAEDNLSAMFRYGVSNWGEAHAQRYLNTFIAEISILARQPEIGKAEGEFRLLPIDQYLIIYSCSKDSVIIHSIRPRGQPR